MSLYILILILNRLTRILNYIHVQYHNLHIVEFLYIYKNKYKNKIYYFILCSNPALFCIRSSTKDITFRQNSSRSCYNFFRVQCFELPCNSVFANSTLFEWRSEYLRQEKCYNSNFTENVNKYFIDEKRYVKVDIIIVVKF